MKTNYQSIVLDKKDMAETDRLYTFYTKEIGLLQVSAKGIRKAQSRLASQVEIFTLTNISVAKNRGRGTLAGAVLENSFDNLKSDFLTLSEVYRARNIFLQVIYGHETDPVLFDLFLEYLNLVNNLSQENLEEKAIWMTNAFIFKLYFLQGYHFTFQKCQECKKDLLPEEQNFFSTFTGGFVCQNCARKIKFKNQIEINTIKALRLLTKNTLTNLAKVFVDDKVNNQMSVMTKDILKWILR
jgi:DNA repair protein RecO (recombination protein O)